MPGRRILIIGSQCNKYNSKLSFLPDLAQRLYDLMADPGPGEFVATPGENCRSQLLLDPSVREAKDAIKAALDEVGKSDETLILAYIGHGEFSEDSGGDFYLMPTDASETTSDGAIHLAEFIKDRIKFWHGRGGLVVLLDSCHAGEAVWQSMERWAQSQTIQSGFEILTATDDRATANAPLIRALIGVLERGDPMSDARIQCRHIHRILKELHRPTQHVAYNGDDNRFYLARNPAKDPGDVFWKDSPGRAQILKQTEYFLPTYQLAQLVESSRLHPVVVLTGETGVGKSTLAAAFARPDLTSGMVPDEFVQAVAILDSTTNQRILAADLSKQLHRSVPSWPEAVGTFERSTPLQERERLGLLRAKVLRPLAYLPGSPSIRIVLDGLNHLDEITRTTIGELLQERPAALSLIITTHPETSECPTGHRLHFNRTRREDLNTYLSGRRIPIESRVAILTRAHDHWLLTQLLSDAVLAEPAIDLRNLPQTVDGAYAKLLDQAGASDAWLDGYRAVLGPLAVAGVGSGVPLSLLIHASEILGGPKGEEAVRNLLKKLRGLILRRDMNTPAEHVILFHPTLADFLLSQAAQSIGYGLGQNEIHLALIQAIGALAPVASCETEAPIQRYAFLRETGHLWAIKDYDGCMTSLLERHSMSPAENVERITFWLSRFQGVLVEADYKRLLLRRELASWTGRAGDAKKALEMCQALLFDLIGNSNSSEKDIIETKINIAHWTLLDGNPKEALRLCRSLLVCPDLMDVAAEGTTQAIQNTIAACVGRLGDPQVALDVLMDILPVIQRMMGDDNEFTIVIRNNIATWTGISGDLPKVVEILDSLLPDATRVLGPNHPITFSVRTTMANLRGRMGDWPTSKQLFVALLRDQRKMLHSRHPDILTTRHNIASLKGETGDYKGAIKRYEALLPLRRKVIGPFHYHTFLTRINLAASYLFDDDSLNALTLLYKILAESELELGRDHPLSLDAIKYIASATFKESRIAESLEWLHEGLSRAAARFGDGSPISNSFRAIIQAYDPDAY
ncbi:tetratricopeptide repeat protein [Isosphaeraceae bacterium EP7]